MIVSNRYSEKLFTPSKFESSEKTRRKGEYSSTERKSEIPDLASMSADTSSQFEFPEFSRFVASICSLQITPSLTLPVKYLCEPSEQMQRVMALECKVH